MGIIHFYRPVSPENLGSSLEARHETDFCINRPLWQADSAFHQPIQCCNNKSSLFVFYLEQYLDWQKTGWLPVKVASRTDRLTSHKHDLLAFDWCLVALSSCLEGYMKVVMPLDARCFLMSLSVPYQLKPLVEWPIRGRCTLAVKQGYTGQRCEVEACNMLRRGTNS